MPTYEELGLGRRAAAYAPSDARAVFGQVMGLVAFTLGFFALGAYLTRNAVGGTGIGTMIGAFACIFALQWAAARGHEQLAIGLLFGMGLLLGLGLGPILAYYAKAQPNVLWQAGACTAGFVGGLGCYGYATRRDFTGWGRTLFWALLALIVFGLIATFVAIPGGHVIYAVAGLAIFGAYSVFEFNLLRRSGMESAVPIAAGIFLNILNVFLLFLSLFGGGGSRR